MRARLDPTARTFSAGLARMKLQHDPQDLLRDNITVIAAWCGRAEAESGYFLD